MPMESGLLGKRYEKDYTEEELEQIFSGITTAVAVPVNVAIKAEHRVLDLSRMTEILRGAKRIVLQDCGCKVDKGNCDTPRDVCLSIDEAADYEQEFDRYDPKEIGLEEALDVLRRSHEAGLVHMAYTMEGDDTPKILCSCCPCCCHTLSGLLRFGIAKHVLKSDLIARTNMDICQGCGVCVERCVFSARMMVDGELVFDAENCFGCGLCVSTCPEGAIRLIEKNGSS
ncbi:MAG: 4Fe-4S binding protein [Candidatus Bathyarchaeota archaeon]|nr:MAG: 4Fe-4S binding protein [Candidatus Bathyarchaeota archaeon]